MIITSQILLFASSSLFVLFLHFFQTCDANCSPSACGTIHNISSPFRLKGDPKNCGDRRFEFVCENNVTSLYLNSHKFYVKEINYSHNDAYDNSTIRLVDASINNHTCSVPTSSLSDYNFSRNNHRPYPYLTRIDSSNLINIMSCPDPLKDSPLFTEITHCQTFNSNSSHSRFTYIKVGRMNASAVRQTCRVELMVMTSWGFKDSNNVSLEEIHHSLLYGFELTVCPWCRSSTVWDEFRIGLIPVLLIILGLLCAAVSATIMIIIGFSFVLGITSYYIGPTIYYTIKYGMPSKMAAFDISLTAIIFAPRFFIFPFAR